MPYVTPLKARQYYQVTNQTLRRWDKNNEISTKTTSGGHRRYYIPNKLQIQSKRKSIIYCRVSSKKQEKDLQRQIKYMQKKFPKHEVIFDIASGVTFNRPKFKSLLKQIFKGSIANVVVSTRDRFTRFNFEFFEWLFKEFDCELHSVQKEKFDSKEQELSQDLISIVTSFAAREHGRRRYK